MDRQGLTLTTHSKEAASPKLKRLLRSAAKGGKAGRSAFSGPLWRAKKGRTKKADSYIRSHIREDGFLNEVLPKRRLKKTAVDWEALTRGLYADSTNLSALIKIASDKPKFSVRSLDQYFKKEGSTQPVKDGPNSSTKRDALLDKVASTMSRLDSENRGHEKRAHALRLLYKQHEMGLAHLPQTYSELQEKLAAMVSDDLGILEKALELTGGNQKLGELAERHAGPSLDASEKFRAVVFGELDA